MPPEDEGKNATRGLSPAVLRTLAEVHNGFLQFLRRHLRNEAEAEDVMQQFHLRVVVHAHDLRAEKSVRLWLRRVLESALRDHQRRQAARRRAEADFARRDAGVPATEADLDRVVCLCLYEALPILKAEYADVLRRADLEGEPRAAIAARLGVSANGLAVRLHRARRALRRVLELSCETCPIHGFFDCGCDYTRRLRSSHARGDGSPTSTGV